MNRFVTIGVTMAAALAATMVVQAARGVYWVVPNLAQFDVKAQVVHGQTVPAGYLALTIAYAALYVAMLIALASLVFSRRDFK